MQKATFAAGCFWGVEEAFRQLKGVVSTQVGYSGGSAENPTYEQVCTGDTGHAESVQIIFDPDIISYKDLLQNFWQIHNPTTKNRQGFDIGTQYRSAIFYHDDEQKEIALKSIQEVQDSKKFDKEIITEIVPAQRFWPAEEYHQCYISKRGGKSCGL